MEALQSAERHDVPLGRPSALLPACAPSLLARSRRGKPGRVPSVPRLRRTGPGSRSTAMTKSFPPGNRLDP